MTKSISYKTTITGITEVVLEGHVVGRDRGDSDMSDFVYEIGGDVIDDWLERVEGEYITLKLTVHDNRPDDSDLVSDEDRQESEYE